MTTCADVRPEDIVRYLDGELAGGRAELVEAHLQVCPLCRQWRAEFEWTGRALRAAFPLTDDPAGRAELRARLARAATRRSPRRAPPLLRAAAFTLLLAAGLALALAASAPARANVGLGRFVRFVDAAAGRGLPLVQAPPTPLPTAIPAPPAGVSGLPFTPQTPATLPLGLRLEGQTLLTSRRLELRYRNDRGLVVTLSQERARDVTYTIATARGKLVMIGETEVLWQPDPRPDSVAALTWEQGGVLYTLAVDESPPGGWQFADARQVAEALLGVP